MSRERRQGIVDFFDQGYPWWQQVYEHQLPRGFFSFEMIRRKEAVLHAVRNRLQQRVGMRILECGCGPGGLLRELPADDHRVYGLDINQRSLYAVREHCAQAVPVCGDIERLPFATGSFDMVLCIGVLSYLPSDEPAVKEMVRLLKPGGQLLIANPNLFMMDKLLDPFYLLVWPLQKLGRFLAGPDAQAGRFTSGMIRRYRYGQLDRLFRQSGLVTTGRTGTSYGPLRFWRKEYFSLARSIRISELLVRLADWKNFRFLQRLANHWVTCLEKPALLSRKGL